MKKKTQKKIFKKKKLWNKALRAWMYKDLFIENKEEWEKNNDENTTQKKSKKNYK